MPQCLWGIFGRVARGVSRVALACALLGLACALSVDASARKKRRPPAGGRVAVVADERLAVLREAPELTAALVRRLGRGSFVAVTGVRESTDGVRFCRVVVTRRTSGWVPADALVTPGRAGDDARLLRLARASEGFEQIARALLLLENFPRSPLRPAALLLLGDAAADAAPRLTREARRRLDERELAAVGAPARSYFLNYGGLDRFRRQGVVFTFDEAAKEFRYDGWAWREILRRHPRSPEADEARRRLQVTGAPAPPKVI